ncbi:hypothetical protein AB0K89_28170 [Streptomyces cinnamoneus]|uniref:hypothetical protein n=1 Tax=Streptomyces cinnamoneus TaxID=53446 RepID=UPI0034384274
MQHSMARIAPRPWAGIIDDLEREDDAKGYEPEGSVDALLALLLVTGRAFAGTGVTA